MLGDAAIRDLPGGVEQYLDLRHAARAAALSSPASASSSKGSGGSRVAASYAAGAGQSGSIPDRPSAAELREAKKDLNRIDRQLSKISAQEERIHGQMATKAADHTAVLALNDTLRAIVDERETLELEWLSVAEFIG